MKKATPKKPDDTRKRLRDLERWVKRADAIIAGLVELQTLQARRDGWGGGRRGSK